MHYSFHIDQLGGKKSLQCQMDFRWVYSRHPPQAGNVAGKQNHTHTVNSRSDAWGRGSFIAFTQIYAFTTPFSSPEPFSFLLACGDAGGSFAGEMRGSGNKRFSSPRARSIRPKIGDLHDSVICLVYNYQNPSLFAFIIIICFYFSIFRNFYLTPLWN